MAQNETQSKYARKIVQQKRGNFSQKSPFSLSDSGGVELSRFNKMRFKHSRDDAKR